MSELVTDRELNISQLCYEMGGASLRVVGPEEDGTYKVNADGTGEKKLQDFINAHVADKDWVNPETEKAEKQAADENRAKHEQIATDLGITVEKLAILKEVLRD